MGNDYGVKKSWHINALSRSTGALDKWAPGRVTSKSCAQTSITNRLKRITVSLPSIPIRDNERSDVPISKLLDDPTQEWSLEDIEKELV